MKKTITDFLIGHEKDLIDLIAFISVVVMGVITKVYKEVLKGKKPSLKWFLAEAFLSFFVAISVWAVFDQFFEMNKIFTYVICAWAGSLSTLFHAKVERLFSVCFDRIESYIKAK